MEQEVLQQTRKPVVAYNKRDRWLIVITLALCVLLDRLIFGGKLEFAGYGIFWICAVLTGLCWCFDTAKKSYMAWLIALLCMALCVWNFSFNQGSIRLINLAVIPGLAMLAAIFAINDYASKEDANVLYNWFMGWVYKPFNRIGRLFGAIGSAFNTAGSKTLRNVLIGLLISIPILAIVLPLLFSADAVFNYYGVQFLEKLNIGEVLLHTILVFTAMLFVYSFFYNLRHAPEKMQLKPITAAWDKTVVGVALGVLLLVYILFIGIQITYLFGGTGLPQGMTYSNYARRGFFELLAVAAINISAFGLCLRFTRENKVIMVLLCALLAATGVMIASSLVRLFMYIEAYHLTWLRIYALWFLIFMCAAVVFCAIRIFWRKLPLLRVCAVMLTVWYIVLAFSNIDGIIARYNIQKTGGLDWKLQNDLLQLKPDQSQASQNGAEMLSDDAIPVLVDYYIDYLDHPDPSLPQFRLYLIARKVDIDKHCYTFSSKRASDLIGQYVIPR